MQYQMVCSDCRRRVEERGFSGGEMRCGACGGVAEVVYPGKGPEDFRLGPASGTDGVWRYRSLLPDTFPEITLGEGNTPLVACPALAARMGLAELRVKNEGLNPTGSYKDRGMAVAVSKAAEQGYGTMVLGSAGNAGLAAAAYSAHAGLRCVLLLPEGAVSERVRLSQICGALVVRVNGTIHDCIRLSEALGKKYGWCNLSTARPFNPYLVEGYQSIGFELCEQYGGDLPDWVVVPVGGGSLISEIWAGMARMKRYGAVRKLPRILGVQAEGCAPYVRHLRSGEPPRQWKDPKTVAFSISDVWPFDWKWADLSLQESGGTAVAVSDGELCRAQRALAETHAVLAEPSSAATVAAVAKMRAAGAISAEERVCCVISGSGLKDVDQMYGERRLPPAVAGDCDAVLCELKEHCGVAGNESSACRGRGKKGAVKDE